MKTNTLKNIALFTLVLAIGCKQEVIDLKTPEVPVDTSCEDATAGTADFSKFIVVGTSFTAGFQAGALFTAGQDASLGVILNKDFSCAGAPAAFKQPDIKTVLGYNLFVAPNPGSDQRVIGRYLLQGADPKPTPQLAALGDVSGLPDPTYNPAFLVSAGDKVGLQNFSVEAITLGQFLIPNTGNWADPNPAHGFSPFYARFASNPGTSTIIGDAAAAGGTFVLFWAGLDDYMLYAAYGGDKTRAPLTGTGAFDAQYKAAVGALMNSNANLKGVIANFPDIFMFPHFNAVPYNPIPLTSGKADTLSAAFGGYNQVIDALIANATAFGINDDKKAELATRKVTYSASATNTPIMVDQSLLDIGPYLDILKNMGQISAQQRAQLALYEQIRQTKSTDVLPLSTGAVLGIELNEDGTAVYGVTVPLEDRHVITPEEKDSINTARTAFNATVAATAALYPDRLAVADMATGFQGIAVAGATIQNGVLLTYGVAPPTGMFSEDLLHPNSRGYAFISNIIVDAVNAKFGATVPHTNIAQYGATALPIP